MTNPSNVTLSFLSWNVQGLGESDKCDCVRSAVYSVDPCIACIQETKLSALNPFKLASFLPRRLSAFAVKDADGSRGDRHRLGPPPFSSCLLAHLPVLAHQGPGVDVH